MAHELAKKTEETIVTGIFGDSENAERAYQFALDRGYGKDDINVVMSDDTRKRYFAEDRPIETELARREAEGGELGGPKGGRIGLVIPIVAAVGAAIAIPGLGLVAAGPIATAIAAAGAAGAAAGIIGLLADWGIPEERVRHYEEGINAGGILLSLKPRSQADAREIGQLWESLGARHVHA
jgi:hypothetical protein